MRRHIREHTLLAPLTDVLQRPIAQVIKGCWQLSGGHKGDSATDRTGGAAALEDFQTFFNAGITTWDAADHYGPAEDLIGRCVPFTLLHFMRRCQDYM